MNNKILGNRGEKEAAAYLEKHGYTIRERNFRAKTGEIDIIAGKGNTIIFVEVKTRASYAYGMPSEAVTAAKQRKIIRTAELYIQSRRLYGCLCRFDVLEVLAPRSGSLSFRLLENAFEA